MARSVVVIGSDTRSFLSAIRSFGRNGANVDVIPLQDNDPALRSKYIRRIHKIGVPQNRREDWVRAVASLADTHGYDLVLPVDDRSIIPIDEFRGVFTDKATLAIPSGAMIETINSKKVMREASRKAGVPVSEGMFAENPARIRPIVRQIGLPCVLKPVSSFSRTELSSKRCVRKAFTQQDIDSLLSGEFKEGAALVERNFIGFGVGVTVLCKGGDVLAAMQHQRVHEPLHGGGSSYRMTTRLSEDLIGYTEKLMAAVGYTGVAMVEFKRNPETGEAIFIEVNGRLAGSLPLCLLAKFDLPVWYGEMLLEGRSDFPREYKIGRYARAMSMDARWLKTNLHADKANQALATVPVHKTFLEPLRLLTGSESLDSISRDDPAPGAAELRLLVRKRLLTRKYQYPPIRQERALSSGSRVLIICKGNICRSPFAARVLSRLRPDMYVESAGYYPVEGRRSPNEAVQAATSFGVDLTPHRSRRFTNDMLAAVNAVIVFDRENLIELALHHGVAMPKVFALGERYIEDPYGKGVEEFEACYREIEGLCRRLAVASPA